MVWLAGMLLVGWSANLGVIIVGAFLASLALGLYLQVAYTYTAESFPTRARSTGFAFADGIGHAGGVAGALLLPVWVTALSFFGGSRSSGEPACSPGSWRCSARPRPAGGWKPSRSEHRCTIPPRRCPQAERAAISTAPGRPARR